MKTMLLSDAIEHFDLSRVGRSPNTRNWYRRMLNPLASYLNNPHVSQVTIHDLRRWHQHLETKNQKWGGDSTHPTEAKPLSPWTIRAHLRATRIFFNFLHDEEHITTNPADRLKIPPPPVEPPKAITPAQLTKFINAAHSNRDRAIILFLADTACRVTGLITLRIPDLDLDNNCAIVREKGRGGARQARYVFFSPLTNRALSEWIQQRPPSKTDHVFTGQRGPLSTSGIYQILKRTAKRAGIKTFNPHAFRHGWARAALQNGADLGTVADVLGHSSVNVTHQFYARWAKHELAARHAKFTWIKEENNHSEEPTN